MLARQEINITLLAFDVDVRLLKNAEEIQDGEALEDERKARHEKLAAAKVLQLLNVELSQVELIIFFGGVTGLTGPTAISFGGSKKRPG